MVAWCQLRNALPLLANPRAPIPARRCLHPVSMHADSAPFKPVISTPQARNTQLSSGNSCARAHSVQHAAETGSSGTAPSGLDFSKHCSIRRWLHQALIIIRQASSGLARPASLPKGTAPGLQSTQLPQAANAAFTAADTAPISALPANCALAAAISLPISAAVGLRLLSASNAAAMACTAAAISASLMRAGK